VYVGISCFYRYLLLVVASTTTVELDPGALKVSGRDFLFCTQLPTSTTEQGTKEKTATISVHLPSQLLFCFAVWLGRKRQIERSGTMIGSRFGLAVAAITLASVHAFAPPSAFATRTAAVRSNTAIAVETNNDNVAQTENTSRDKVMTFSYDMNVDAKYEKPTYPGTGNGLSGDSGEYDVIVIGSGMGGLACGAVSAKYGDKVLVLESHIKCGGSAHTFTRVHNGEKYNFEVGPSIFEGLDRASLNPLRMIFDLLDEQMPVKTYTGLGYWTPTGYWRFPIGSQTKFEDLLMAQAEDGPLAVKVRMHETLNLQCPRFHSLSLYL
jgi:hypothetical protein